MLLLNLTFDDALCQIAVERLRDDLSSHMLLAVPSQEAWAVINLRNPLDIAFAIGRDDVTPASFIGAVEFDHWKTALVPEKMESVLLVLLSQRAHSGLLVNMLEVWNIAHNTGQTEEDYFDIQEQFETMSADDVVADEGQQPHGALNNSQPVGEILHPPDAGGARGVEDDSQPGN